MNTPKLNMRSATMRNTLRNRNQKGFTLVELLIVIIIIAVLAAIAIPKFANSTTKGKESTLRANLKVMRNAIDLFRADTGAFPASLAALNATAAPTAGLDAAGGSLTIIAADWRGPYLDATPAEPITGLTTTWTYTITGANTGRVVTGSAGYTGW
jgi:type II secretion system protein G